MNIILDCEDKKHSFNIYNVYFGEKVPNTIVENSSFYNIIYSTNKITLSNLHILILLKSINLTNYYNKYKVFFIPSINFKIMNKMKKIEQEILLKFKKFRTKKTPVFNLYNQILTKQIKVNSKEPISQKKDTIQLLLKISGIWENNTNYGIIYSFIHQPSVT